MSRGPLTLRSLPSRLRTLAPRLSAVALLFGSLPLHLPHDDHDVLAGSMRVFVTQHGQSTTSCVEAAHSVELPRCPACILQLQGLGTPAVAAQPSSRLVAVGLVAIDETRTVAHAAPRLVLSRGPPQA